MITSLNRNETQPRCKLENETGRSTRQGLQLTTGQTHNIKLLQEARTSSVIRKPSDHGSRSTVQECAMYYSLNHVM